MSRCLPFALIVIALVGCEVGTISDRLAPVADPIALQCVDYEGVEDPGFVPLRRLNRVELDNSLSDLLGTSVSYANDFPADPIGYGYDNLGEFQAVSPVLFEAYYDTGVDLVDGVIAAPKPLLYDRFEAEQLPGYTLGGFPAGSPQGEYFFFPGVVYLASPTPYVFKDASYRIRFKAHGAIENMLKVPRVSIRLGTQPATFVDVTAVAGSDEVYEVVIPMAAELGEVEIGLHNGFSRNNFDPLYQPLTSCTHINGMQDECFDNATGNQCVNDLCREITNCLVDADCGGGLKCGTFNGCTAVRPCCYDPGVQRRQLWVDWFEIEELGQAPAPNPLREALVSCDPEMLGDDVCAREVFSIFGRRAWRRPLTTEELDRLGTLFQLAFDEGDGFNEGLNLGLRTILLSPHFLFRVETDADPTSEEPHPVSDHELATRLSYFLWSSLPDEELLGLADAGSLTDPQVLEAQVARMLESPKATQLSTNFGDQWLFTRLIDTVAPAPQLFPEFDEDLRVAMKAEARSFFANFQEDNRSMLELVSAEETYVNDRLAEHYGLPPVGSDDVVLTSMAGTGRRGILGQAGLLTVTSAADHTSIVKRGKWLLGQLLCSEPPPPPPSVEGLSEAVDPNAPLKVQMAQHRSDPACAGCHSYMDPLGFSLEHFDPVGQHRTTDDSGHTVDAGADLPDGRSFYGVEGLSNALVEDPQFTRCMSEQMLTYAVGRGFRAADTCGVHQLSQSWGEDDFRYRDLVRSIIESPYFLQRRGEGESNE